MHQAMPWLWCFFSFLYLLKDPDLETAFHFMWELRICRITGHCLLLLSKVFLFGLCARIKGFTKLHAEYFNKIHNKAMNYAILQVRLGHYLNL